MCCVENIYSPGKTAYILLYFTEKFNQNSECCLIWIELLILFPPLLYCAKFPFLWFKCGYPMLNLWGTLSNLVSLGFLLGYHTIHMSSSWRLHEYLEQIVLLTSPKTLFLCSKPWCYSICCAYALESPWLHLSKGDNQFFYFWLQTIFLPVVGLVDPDKLKPGDLVGVNKDSYLILDTLPSEYDSRVKAMEVDEKPTEDYNDIGGLEKQASFWFSVLFRRILPWLLLFVNIGTLNSNYVFCFFISTDPRISWGHCFANDT